MLRYKGVTLKYVGHENAGYIKFSVFAYYFFPIFMKLHIHWTEIFYFSEIKPYVCVTTRYWDVRKFLNEIWVIR